MLSPRDQLRQRIIARLEDLSVEALAEVDRNVSRLITDGDPRSVSEKERRIEMQHSKDWPHAPRHRLSDRGTYIVTGGTHHKIHVFKGLDRLDLLESALLAAAKKHGWQLEAWAAFSNHYHSVAHALPEATNLREFVKCFHGETAIAVNGLDGATGRRVWYNFWETQLTYEKSYFARLNYVHQNAVKHGLVPVANQYRWCSAAWFERTATPAQVKTIYRFKTDKVRVVDDFQPET